MAKTKKKRPYDESIEKSNKEIGRIVAAKKARAENKKKAAPKTTVSSQSQKKSKAASIPNFQGRTMAEIGAAAKNAAKSILGTKKKKADAKKSK